ncbi:hypothetical protein Pcinc_039800 [Petrolisthes cinctipes]|uniref:Uncharacterized protein n=1 Tax=Petrolisthes cinctipes TaxID=88211 RepID=A0AAE1BN93_PETCI|nr:hypothetical protein Pcinc_039800 [Petrolisthes cinctipes]
MLIVDARRSQNPWSRHYSLVILFGSKSPKINDDEFVLMNSGPYVDPKFPPPEEYSQNSYIHLRVTTIIQHNTTLTMACTRPACSTAERPCSTIMLAITNRPVSCHNTNPWPPISAHNSHPATAPCSSIKYLPDRLSHHRTHQRLPLERAAVWAHKWHNIWVEAVWRFTGGDGDGAGR